MLPKEIAGDLLIVGGGVAAMSAGMEAAKLGLKVVVVDKGRVGFSGSSPTSGGNPQFPFPEEQGGAPGDGPEVLARDIASGGYGLSDPEALHLFVGEGLRVLTEHAACGCLLYTSPSPRDS